MSDKRRIIVGGYTKAGKTTWAKDQPGVVRHLDDLHTKQKLGWSESSEAGSRWFDEPYDVIEGVSAFRALRKWLDKNPKGKPCDELHVFRKTYQKLSPGHESMNKGTDTVFKDIESELRSRGVQIKVF